MTAATHTYVPRDEKYGLVALETISAEKALQVLDDLQAMTDLPWDIGNRETMAKIDHIYSGHEAPRKIIYQGKLTPAQVMAIAQLEQRGIISYKLDERALMAGLDTEQTVVINSFHPERLKERAQGEAARREAGPQIADILNAFSVEVGLCAAGETLWKFDGMRIISVRPLDFTDPNPKNLDHNPRAHTAFNMLNRTGALTLGTDGMDHSYQVVTNFDLKKLQDIPLCRKAYLLTECLNLPASVDTEAKTITFSFQDGDIDKVRDKMMDLQGAGVGNHWQLGLKNNFYFLADDVDLDALQTYAVTKAAQCTIFKDGIVQNDRVQEKNIETIHN